MKVHQKITLTAFAVLILAIFFSTVFLNPAPKSGVHSPAPATSPSTSSVKTAPSQSVTSKMNTKSQESPPPSPPPRSDVLDWVQKNAAHMNSFSANDQAELDQFVKSLQTEDMKELKEAASSTARPANQRVLAVFLLGQSPLGEKALSDFLTQEIPLKEKAPAHSVEEVANGREKALRVMALEDLVTSAPNPEEAKKRLAALIPSIKDPWLKAFARRKLQGL